MHPEKSKSKVVRFNSIPTVHSTYSSDEYDRFIIDSILYMWCLKRVSTEEWLQVFIELNSYKMNEMIVHKYSIQNTKFHAT